MSPIEPTTNVERILRNGSKVCELQQEAVAIYDLCMRHFVRLEVLWIPREENAKADYMSKYLCKDDYKLDPNVFERLNDRWGPHTIDWFASHLSTQLPRFFSQFWCPGCEGWMRLPHHGQVRTAGFFPAHILCLE